MRLKNKYANRSKIAEAKFRDLLSVFALNLDATQIAKLTRLKRSTANRFLRTIRQRLAEFCEQHLLFPEKRRSTNQRKTQTRDITVKPLSSASSKAMVKYVQQLSLITQKPPYKPCIRGRVKMESVICSDGWRAYNALVDVGYGKHLRIDHTYNAFARG